MRNPIQALVVFVVVCVLLGGALSDAHALRLRPHDRNGPYVGIGVGGGPVGASGGDQQAIDELGTSGGVNVNFRIGFALSDYITVGIESSGWAKKYDLEQSSELTVNFFFTGIAGTIYPKNIGFYVRGGFGVATVSGKLTVPGEPDEEPEPSYGFGGIVATGYEWRLTQRLALGPQVEAAFLQPNGELIKDVWYLSFTAQANWYF